MTKRARDAGVGRESLYKARAPGAKPRYDTVLKLTRAAGVRLTVVAMANAGQRQTTKNPQNECSCGFLGNLWRCQPIFW